jgi:hypothetical protein
VKAALFSTSAVLEDILPNPQSPIILPPSLVCICGLDISSFKLLMRLPPYSVALEGFTESIRKEMTPEWNIQATIIEPGGFNTDWRNMETQLPLHPAYDTDNSPAKQHRSMHMGTGTAGSGIPFIGSPEKAAKAFITVAEKKRQDLPLRIQFGSDSLAFVRYTAMKTISDGEKLESVSHSTNVDCVDAKEYTKHLLTVLG